MSLSVSEFTREATLTVLCGMKVSLTRLVPREHLSFMVINV